MKHQHILVLFLLSTAVISFLVHSRIVKIPTFIYLKSNCEEVTKEETELQKEVKTIFNKVNSSIPKISFTHFDNTTSALNSKATIINPKDKYCVGDSLTVQVDMFDHLGKRKTYGGDFMTARIYSPDIKASASGRVEDLRNGSYHIHYTLFWQGTVQFSILMVHPSELTSALWHGRNKGYGYVAHTGHFVYKGNEAKVKCGYDLNQTQELCEYSNPKEEEYFYCEKPVNIPCGAMIQIMSVFVDTHSYLSEAEKHLLIRSNIRVEIPKNFGTISVTLSSGNITEEKKKCSSGFNSTFPSGYFYQNMWNHRYCSITRYRNMNDINECLKGKIVYMTGDSTMLQWMTYINNQVKSLLAINLYNENWPMTRLFVDLERNIKIEWRKHTKPFMMLVFHTFKEEYTIPDQIDHISGNQYTVYIFTLGMHFRLFPLERYIRRVINIRRAIEQLHLRSPETKVIVKMENTSEIDEHIEMMNDFHGIVQYSILKNVLQGLNVFVVDAWDMTVAYASENTHPSQEVIASEVDWLLTYMCQ